MKKEVKKPDVKNPLNNILRDYPYLSLTIDEKSKLLNKISSTVSKREYGITKEEYDNLIITLVESIIKSKVKLDPINMVIKYIDNMFIKSSKTTDISLNMELLEDFIDKYKIDLDYESTTKLIEESNILKSTIGYIVSSKDKVNLGVNSLSFVDAYNISYGKVESDPYELDINEFNSDSYYDGFKAFITNLNSDNLTQKEEQEYFKTIENGAEKDKHKAREILASHNMRLVVKIAKPFMNSGLPFEDVIQDGCEGLTEALNRFDYKKGYKFSTYATWWIRKYIHKGINEKVRMIRIPTHLLEAMIKIRKFSTNFELTHFRMPTEEEIREEYKDLTIEKIRSLTTLPNGNESLNAPVTCDDAKDTELQDLIEDKSANRIDEVVNKIFYENFLKVLNQVSGIKPRDIEILKYANGFGPKDAMNLREIGEEFGVSKQRVQQILYAVVKKLQENASIKLAASQNETQVVSKKRDKRIREKFIYTLVKESVPKVETQKIVREDLKSSILAATIAQSRRKMHF